MLELDPNMVKLAVTIIGFILGIAGLGVFLVKIFFGRIFAAIKTLFDAKEKIEERCIELEKRIARLEGTIISMSPDKTYLLRNTK